jgi:tripartite-type tricarboxylate transporter receptor subunit TctC
MIMDNRTNGRKLGLVKGFRVMTLLTHFLALVLVAPVALAQDFPTKPLKLIIPYGSGGPTDVGARLLAESMGAQLGQPVISENRPGAFGQIAIDAVKQAGADGYTIMFASLPQAVSFPVILENGKSSSLKTFRTDFRMVGLANSFDNLFYTSPSSGLKSMKDLAERMRAPNGNVTYAAFGAGAMPDVAFAAFSDLVKGKGEAILYKSGPQANTDVIGGRLMIGTDTASSIASMVREGRLVALGTFGKQRSKLLPDVPTVAEAGYPELAKIDLRVWAGFFVPAATPTARVQRLNDALRKAGRDPKVLSRFNDLQNDVLADTSLADAEEFWNAQFINLGPVLRSMNIQLPE